MKTFVFTTLLTLTLITLTFVQSQTPTRNLGADPRQDTVPVYVASKLQVYAERLLSQEKRFLAEQDEANIDFNLWYNDVLSRFMLQQERYSYQTDNDKTRDLNSFKRQLSALKAEFSESKNNRQFAFDSRTVSNYWNTFASKYIEISKDILAAGNQYNALKRQQLTLYAELIEISGAYYDPGTKTYLLINIGGPNSPPFAGLTVAVPSSWVIGLTGPLGGMISPSTFPDYPDSNSKLGVLYSKIISLYMDYNIAGSSGQKQRLKKTFTKYQTMWVDLAQKWLGYRRDTDRIEQKLLSIKQRSSELISLLGQITAAGGLPATVWDSLDKVIANTPYDTVY